MTNKILHCWAPQWPNTHPIHQAATSLPSLPLPGVLTSAHINKVDDHRNREDHTQHTSKQQGKLV